MELLTAIESANSEIAGSIIIGTMLIFAAVLTIINSLQIPLVTEANNVLLNLIVESIIYLGNSIVSTFSDYMVFIKTIIIIIGAITLTNLAGISFLLILINSDDISDFLETVGNQLISSIEELSLAIIELG
jgi:hypothetical protein